MIQVFIDPIFIKFFIKYLRSNYTEIQFHIILNFLFKQMIENIDSYDKKNVSPGSVSYFKEILIF